LFVALKMLLRTLVLPPAGPLLLAAVGAWLALRRGHRRSGGALLLAGLGSLALLSLPPMADLLWRAASREPRLDEARAHEAQAIVILAGGSARSSAPEYGGAPAAGGGLLERLAYGAYLAHRTELPVLISGTLKETQAMQATLGRDFGVTPRWIESRSRDTFENAEFSARLLRAAGVVQVLLVTDAVHEHRAAQEFRATGLQVIAAPTGLWVPPEPHVLRYVPQVEALERSTRSLYELLGDAARRVFAVLGLRRQSR
jgi:uncharacterized SAM-binding protein YcdF (DUF218 family)